MRIKPEANVASKTWRWVWKVSSKAEFLASGSDGLDIFWLFWELYSLLYFSSCLMAQLDFGFLIYGSTLFFPTTQQGGHDKTSQFNQLVPRLQPFFPHHVPAACAWIPVRVGSYKLTSNTVSSIHWEIWTHVTSSPHVLFSISCVLAKPLTSHVAGRPRCICWWGGR